MSRERNNFGEEFAALTVILLDTAADAKESKAVTGKTRSAAIEALRNLVTNFNIALLEDMTYDPMNP